MLTSSSSLLWMFYTDIARVCVIMCQTQLLLEGYLSNTVAFFTRYVFFFGDSFFLRRNLENSERFCLYSLDDHIRVRQRISGKLRS